MPIRFIQRYLKLSINYTKFIKIKWIILRRIKKNKNKIKKFDEKLLENEKDIEDYKLISE